MNGADAPNNSAVYAPNLFTLLRGGGQRWASNTPGLRASAVGLDRQLAAICGSLGAPSTIGCEQFRLVRRPLGVLSGSERVDLGERKLCCEPTGYLCLARRRLRQQRPRGRESSLQLDRRQRQFLALWRTGLRFQMGTLASSTIFGSSILQPRQWTWMGGSNRWQTSPRIRNAGYRLLRQNSPEADWRLSWTDSSGNFWLFGGEGMSSTGTACPLTISGNSFPQRRMDLGEREQYQPRQAGNGVYGTLGVAAAGNVPGRRLPASWTDSSGNLWLYGGEGLDSTGTSGNCRDLWEFSTSTTQWTWVGGSNTANQQGVYGTMGSPAASNAPGARDSAVSWMDGSGNLWLFGGGGSAGFFNDLWRHQP